MLISKKKRLAGLEIDTGEIRAVQLSGTHQAPRLEAWGRESLPQEAVNEGIIQQPQQVAHALMKLWSEEGFKGENVVLGVSNKEVLVRFANFQKVPEDKLGGLIKHQAQEHLPLPLESVIMDYTVIGEAGGQSGNMYEVILVAAKREMLDVFISTLSAARLNIMDIDVSSLVLLKSVCDIQREGAVFLVDIANGQSNILILARNVPRLSRRVPFCLKDAADMLELKVEEMLSQNTLAEFPTEKYQGWQNSFISEIRSSISYYQAQPGALEVEEILLSGKGARAPGLAAYTEESSGIPVKTIKPFKGVDNYNSIGSGQELDYSVAMSLALRGLEG